MKKIVVILLMFVSLGATSQTDKGMFFDASMGMRIGGETSTLSTVGPGFHANGGIGYMFNNWIGIEGNLGLNTFKAISVADNGITDRSILINSSLQAVIGLSQLIGFGTEKFDLYLHTGFGFSSFSNPAFKDGFKETAEFGDRFFKGNDESMNITFGLTPRFHVNEKISVNLDASYFLLFGQNHSLDREIGDTFIDGATGITNISLGITYRL